MNLNAVALPVPKLPEAKPYNNEPLVDNVDCHSYVIDVIRCDEEGNSIKEKELVYKPKLYFSIRDGDNEICRLRTSSTSFPVQFIDDVNGEKLICCCVPCDRPYGLSLYRLDGSMVHSSYIVEHYHEDVLYRDSEYMVVSSWVWTPISFVLIYKIADFLSTPGYIPVRYCNEGFIYKEMMMCDGLLKYPVEPYDGHSYDDDDDDDDDDREIPFVLYKPGELYEKLLSENASEREMFRKFLGVQ